MYYRPKMLRCRMVNRVFKLFQRDFCVTNYTKISLISTPIFYVNSVPHIGHLYTTVLADALTRWQRLQGNNVIFSTGTDEHGLKVQQAAEKQGSNPKDFCDNISQKFLSLFGVADIKYDKYIRTTDAKHAKAVHALWNKLSAAGHIYRGKYEGWYCTSDEMFLKEDDIELKTLEDGTTIKVSNTSGHPVEWIKEDNYMFTLSKFRPHLLKWLENDVIVPAHPYADVVYNMVNSGLDDLSVSRQRDRLQWGIPVPGDDNQTIYVWLDALTNYLTVLGYPDNTHSWGSAYHLVGKDILKFHAVYWPAFLMAAGLQPPKKINCHAHWLMDHKKMSKSLGNVVDPFECIERYGTDAVRYFLLRDGVPHSDGNFSEERLINAVNSELVNTLGNLLSRCLGKKLNPEGVVPQFHPEVWDTFSDADDTNMWNKLDSLSEHVHSDFEQFEIYKAISRIMSHLRDTNGFMEKHKPWELAKLNLNDENTNVEYQRLKLDCILHVTFQTLRICGILLQPVVPNLCDNLLARLNVPYENRNWQCANKSMQSENIWKLGLQQGVLIQRFK